MIFWKKTWSKFVKKKKNAKATKELRMTIEEMLQLYEAQYKKLHNFCWKSKKKKRILTSKENLIVKKKNLTRDLDPIRMKLMS